MSTARLSPPIDTHSLLPPLLACLPTAFASQKPPPALLPLLSPILSQRVELLSESSSGSSWLPLLNWDEEEAGQLESVIENADFEPHPISGEIELGDAEPAKYRRLDKETLQALVSLPDVGLAVVYVWTTAGEGEAWRVAEVKPLPGSWLRNPTPWESSVHAAQDAFEGKTHASATTQQQGSVQQPFKGQPGGKEEEDDDDDDDDYWAQYDTAPGRTPAKQSPAPQASSSKLRQVSNAEDSYWGQYSSVQPAVDGEDPDERAAIGDQLGESGLDGDALLKTILGGQVPAQTLASTTAEAEAEAATALPQRSMFTPNGTRNDTDKLAAAPQRSLYSPNGTSTGAATAGSNNGSFTVFPPTAPLTRHSPADAAYEHIEHPRPQSAQSSGASSRGSSRLVEHLEEQVAHGNNSKRRDTNSSRGSNMAADFAIQQHISTSMKSLYRLSKGAGMDRAEFERIVQAELGVLSMMDDD